MPFQSTPAIVGIPDFGLIHIDPTETAKAFQSYLDTASKLTGVALEDISLSVSSLPSDLARVTLVDLLKCGMKLFDAIVWLTAGRPTSHPLTIDVNMTADKIPSLHEVARSVFYCYFMLVTQARYPVSSSTESKPAIPNFLRTIMGMDKDQSIYVNMICSFEPQKFDPAWAKHVKFSGFGQEVLSRFGLGVAGYRLFGPFALYSAKPDMDPALAPAFEFARKVAKTRPTWAIHPLTRDPGVLSKRGNLNKNLGNLILKVFSEGDIAEMVAARVLYKKPDMEPTHRNYMVWTADDDVSGNDFIF